LHGGEWGGQSIDAKSFKKRPASEGAIEFPHELREGHFQIKKSTSAEKSSA
jgi:hypothetical protein